MALVVEDGTGKSTADSYISLTDADSYFTDHGSPTAWTGLTDANKESALRYASAWLDGRYEWVGSIVSSTQALGWPRSGASDDEGRTVDSDAVPARVEHAVCEVALAHVGTSLNSTFARGGQTVREKVGSVEVEYLPGAPAESTMPHVDRILLGLGALRCAQVTLVRG